MRTRPRAKFWLETESGEYVMGPRTLRLLEAIRETGGLKSAARVAGFSYRSAWSRIRRVETALGFKLIESRSGGEGGGRSILTASGEVFVEKYRLFLKKSARCLDKSFEQAFPDE